MPTPLTLLSEEEQAFRDMVAAFREQILGLVEGGADLIQIETQFDLAECKAAVIAAREVCDLPVSVSMTFEGAQSLTGTARGNGAIAVPFENGDGEVADVGLVLDDEHGLLATEYEAG